MASGTWTNDDRRAHLATAKELAKDPTATQAQRDQAADNAKWWQEKIRQNS